MLIPVFAALAAAFPPVPVEPPPSQERQERQESQSQENQESLRTAADRLAAVGVDVDVQAIEVVTPGASDLVAALGSLNERIFGKNWFVALWVLLDAAGLAVEATPEEFQANYLQGVLTAQMAWYDALGKRVVLQGDALQGSDRELLLAHELTHAAQDQREGLLEIFDRFGPTTDGLLLARCLTEGEAEAATLAVALDRSGRDLSGFPDERLAITPEEQDDGAIRLHYALGRALLVRALQRGGWKAVHEAIAAPPRDTSALLHPARADRPPPPDLALPAWPDADGAVAARVLRDDTWGELGLRMFLKLSGASGSEARLAAIGWRADRLRVWETADGSHAFVWRISFDREADAEQLEAVLARGAAAGLARRGATLEWAVGPRPETTELLAGALAALPLPSAPRERDAQATAALEATLLEATARIEAGRWIVPSVGVRMPAPAGFEVAERNGMPVLFAPVADDEHAERFRDNVVALESTRSPGSTPAEELADVQETLGAEPYAIVATEVRKLSGREVLWLEYTSRQPVGDLHHLEVQWLDGSDRKLSVAATTLESRWKEAGERMIAILAGLEFDTDVAPGAAGR